MAAMLRAVEVKHTKQKSEIRAVITSKKKKKKAPHGGGGGRA